MGGLVAFLLACTVLASVIAMVGEIPFCNCCTSISIRLFFSQGHDELADDSADAEAYAQYMAVTEASAPLVRVHHHRYGHRQPSSTSMFFKNRNRYLMIPAVVKKYQLISATIGLFSQLSLRQVSITHD
jgi:hypothetical protein